MRTLDDNPALWRAGFVRAVCQFCPSDEPDFYGHLMNTNLHFWRRAHLPKTTEHGARRSYDSQHAVISISLSGEVGVSQSTNTTSGTTDIEAIRHILWVTLEDATGTRPSSSSLDFLLTELLKAGISRREIAFLVEEALPVHASES